LKIEATKNLVNSVIQTVENTQIAPIDTVTWAGGTRTADNYYITEESAPAKLGSSLGWLRSTATTCETRSTLLVKAVILFTGKERMAINWLQGARRRDRRARRPTQAPPEQLAEIPHS
jgi:hypothetical protein